MTKPVKFAHVVYRTRRFEAMIAWRAKVFEAEVVDRLASTVAEPRSVGRDKG